MPSKTIVDFPKITAALDNGWAFQLYKNQLGSYTVLAQHADSDFQDSLHPDLSDEDGDITTDDFTPEQALTRAAYKVVDQIILGSGPDFPDVDLKLGRPKGTP